MAAAMPELRTPVMILVDVSWEEQNGVVQKARACMEDKSASGACLRMKTPVVEGSRLSIQWRFEQFAGIVRYCRREGREYVVGIQRAATSSASHQGEVKSADSRQGSDGKNRQVVTVKNKPAPIIETRMSPAETRGRLGESGSRETVKEILGENSAGPKTIEITPLLQSVSLMDKQRPRKPKREDLQGLLQKEQGQNEQRQTEYRQIQQRAEDTSARKATDRERKPMAHKWLGLAPWHNKQDAAAAGESENAKPDEITNSSEIKKNAMAKENRMSMPQSAQNMEKTASISAREVPAFQVELLPMEDIYRTAGIVSPRKGYSVPKVVEMLNSEHIRGLSKETKRAALLMALDAAGVTIEQVQRDGKARQNALDGYETEQKKQAEAEWARKAEEITHIQAELESIKAHYTARISRNMEALARDKARFNSWVTTKEQESQSMGEAVELCLKTPVSEPAVSREREMSAVAAGAASAPAGPAKPM
ncbi:MAG: hypothetical protein WA252_12320 [Candidatus Sulfotelmatobacter sp.]